MSSLSPLPFPVVRLAESSVEGACRGVFRSRPFEACSRAGKRSRRERGTGRGCYSTRSSKRHHYACGGVQKSINHSKMCSLGPLSLLLSTSLFLSALVVDGTQEVCGLKWSFDDKQLASGGNDNKLFIWNAHSTSPVREGERSLPSCAGKENTEALSGAGGGGGRLAFQRRCRLADPLACINRSGG